MTNERKAELFQGAMNWIWEHMESFSKQECIWALEHIGFSKEEIDEELTYCTFEEDDEDEWEEPEWEDDEYTPSSTNGDYSPSNPWDAPGNSISMFIGGVYD